MFENLLNRAQRLAARRRTAVIDRIAAGPLPDGVTASPRDDGVMLSGRGLRFRYLNDVRLRTLGARMPGQ